MGVGPETLGNLHLGSVVDEEEGFIVLEKFMKVSDCGDCRETYSCVCSTPPVHECTDVADSECALDIVRQCEAFTLATVVVPVVVEIVKGRPLGEPDLLVGCEGCAWI